MSILTKIKKHMKKENMNTAEAVLDLFCLEEITDATELDKLLYNKYGEKTDFLNELANCKTSEFTEIELFNHLLDYQVRDLYFEGLFKGISDKKKFELFASEYHYYDISYDLFLEKPHLFDNQHGVIYLMEAVLDNCDLYNQYDEEREEKVIEVYYKMKENLTIDIKQLINENLFFKKIIEENAIKNNLANF